MTGTLDRRIDLAPALVSDEAPTWDGAVWVGELRGPVRDDTEYRLERAEGYRRARLLVREERTLLGFVELDIEDGGLDAAALRRASDGLLPGAVAESAAATAASGPSVTVVVCTRDRVDSLKVALESILSLDHPDYEVIVVDNASRTDATQRFVTELGDPRVRVVTEPRPGLSRARNAGVRAANTEIVAFTDDDVVVDPHWLTELVAGFGAGNAVACVCGIVPSGEIRTPAQAYFDQRVGWASSCVPRLFDLAHPPADVPLFPFQVGVYGTGANFAVDRQAVFALGGFDEALGAGAPTDGGEDLDMFFRVLHAGRQLAYRPGAVVWHRHRADNDALAVQARGYGLGLGAWLAKIAVDPRTAWLAARIAVRQAPTFLRLSRKMSRVATPPDGLADDLPVGIGATELRSIARGPFAYLKARVEGRDPAPLRGLTDEGPS
ncbi:glycosyltransferase family 2 protein [Rhodococcus sp. LB1]|uniref:glycosyltransferase family 2 protein n=1 Tax=Rhodococcus sp. LB1 TaxID=1807499 RepID=UPI00077AFF82|nr:glycosyltransferase [Rhodococcus sp. LB1]KXX57074.1 glycosyl transferase family 2 [Rhodococcus sp. LB1]